MMLTTGHKAKIEYTGNNTANVYLDGFKVKDVLACSVHDNVTQGFASITLKIRVSGLEIVREGKEK